MTRYSSLKNNNEYQFFDVDFAKHIAQEKQTKDRKRLNAGARLLKISVPASAWALFFCVEPM